MNWKLADVNDPRYYWHNFDNVRRWVMTHHERLLSNAQRQVLRDYQALSIDAQCLWLRLHMRKGELFRVSKLNYTEICLSLAVAELKQKGWIRPYDQPSAPALALFTKAELIDFHPDQITPALTKPELIEQMTTTITALPDEVIALCKNEIFKQLSMVFFGNSHQQLSEFVVTAIGHVQYEQYRVRPNAAFPRLQDFQQFCLIDYWQRQYADFTSLEQRVSFAADLLKDTLLRHPAGRNEGKLSRLINRVARDCERAKDVRLALALYRYSKRTPSRERQARLLYKSDKSACHQLLQNMRSDPWDEPERAMASSLLSRWFDHVANDVTEKPKLAEMTLTYQPRQVEEAVLSCYHKHGWLGLHAENLIPQALFGLVFWDIIFADVEGAFIHPFQRSPRDLNSPDFMRHRAARIRRRLTALVRYPDAIKQRISTTLRAKAGVANPFVPWRWKHLPDVKMWFDYLPLTTWQAIFKRIAFDVKNNRSGFPDLWLYNAAGDVQLIEVKAVGDSLRPNQKRWLSFLTTQGIDVHVMNVKPTPLVPR